MGDEPFLVYAGDTFIVSKDFNFLRRLVIAHEEFKAEASLLCESVENPERFGVIIGREISQRRYRIERIIEKPEKPPSNLVAIAVYLFESIIFNALEKTPDTNGEKELTDAIQRLVGGSRSVYAAELRHDEARLDVGTPDAYRSALDRSYDSTVKL